MAQTDGRQFTINPQPDGLLYTEDTFSSVEEDWVARSEGAGVMWAHDFRSDWEVDRWRWVGSWGSDTTKSAPAEFDVGVGQSSVNRVVTDGITGGGCLEITIPTGGQSEASWWRPYSAFPGDIGYNPATNPDIDTTAPNYTAINDWDYGNYGDPSYWGGGNYEDQSDFWLQFRTKISGSRFTPGNPEGKLVFIGRVESTPNQEIVIQSVTDRQYTMYSNFGLKGGDLTNPQGDYQAWPQGYTESTRQPGGVNDATCWRNTVSDNVDCTNCWCFTPDSWETVLVHVTSGLMEPQNQFPSDYREMYDGTSAARGTNSTRIEVWTARYGETAYTKIWDKADYVMVYDSTTQLPSYNSMICSGYMNNINALVGWTHKFDQIIFSKSSIPCPQVYA
jgi:hypothetical protein